MTTTGADCAKAVVALFPGAPPLRVELPRTPSGSAAPARVAASISATHRRAERGRGGDRREAAYRHVEGDGAALAGLLQLRSRRRPTARSPEIAGCGAPVTIGAIGGGPDIDALKARTREAWALGDYSGIAERVTGAAAQPLVDGCAISAGQEVLDVATGTGNVALAAAREGAMVVASDLTAEMLELGRSRAAAEDLEIEWVEADAEQLPFDDERFDCVTSAFGAMFAPRPDLVARELFRVVRPGGTVGMANWHPDAFVARQAKLMARYMPPDPDLPNPTDWGDPEVVQRRFDGLAASLETRVETIVWEGESAEQYVQFVQRSAGPHVLALRMLGPERAQELTAEMTEMIRDIAQGDGPISLRGDYLLVVARKRG